MIISFETGLYNDGMTIEMMDCVNIPIAAASGYYRSENYFYYALIFAIGNNWRTEGDIIDVEFVKRSNENL